MTGTAVRRSGTGAPGRDRTVTRRLLAEELRLVSRDPFTLVFTVGFPIMCMLTLGGVFGTQPGAHGFLVEQVAAHKADGSPHVAGGQQRHRSCGIDALAGQIVRRPAAHHRIDVDGVGRKRPRGQFSERLSERLTHG